MRAHLDGDKDGMGLAGYADHDGALLDGFAGIFNLKYSSLRRAREDQYCVSWCYLIGGRAMVVKLTM